MPVEHDGHTFPGYNQPIRSSNPDKKKMVLVKKGEEVRLVHFGQRGYKHNYSKAAKENYLARSAGIRDKDGNLTKDDPFSPNYWARRVLWPGGPADGSALATSRDVDGVGNQRKTAENTTRRLQDKVQTLRDK